VRIYDGEVDDGGTREGDTVLACQATVSGDAVIEFDEVPLPVKRSGSRRVIPLTWLTKADVEYGFCRKMRVLPPAIGSTHVLKNSLPHPHVSLIALMTRGWK
jgi:hypothetical protein